MSNNDKFMVIGLVGAKGAGKDSVADIAIEKFRADRKIHITDPFKEKILKGVFEFSDKNIYDAKGKDEFIPNDIILTHRVLRKTLRAVCESYNDVFGRVIKSYYDVALSQWENTKFVAGKSTYRDVARFLSTDVIRKIIPDWHITVASPNIPLSGVTFIPDIRFKNECDSLNQRFGDKFKLVYVKNKNAEEKAGDHPTEQLFRDLGDIEHYVLENEGKSLKVLEAEAANVMAELMGSKKAKVKEKRGGKQNNESQRDITAEALPSGGNI